VRSADSAATDIAPSRAEGISAMAALHHRQINLM
jgi:hypothetical protein